MSVNHDIPYHTRVPPKPIGRADYILLAIGICSFCILVLLKLTEVVHSNWWLVPAVLMPIVCSIICSTLHPTICARHGCGMDGSLFGCWTCDVEQGIEKVKKRQRKEREARIAEITEGVRNAFESCGHSDKIGEMVEVVAAAVSREVPKGRNRKK